MTKKMGRPRVVAAQEEPLAKYDIRLSFRQARLARRIGGQNLSQGVRTAIEKAAADAEFMEALPPLKVKEPK